VPRKPKPWTTKKLAVTIARLADEKQAGDILVLDVGQAIQVSDYFVLASGQNRRHMGVIGEFVASQLKKDGFYRMGGSPQPDESWVLLDFGPVVLHVFSPKARKFYDLENLWGDCPRVKWKAAVRKRAAKSAEEEPAGLGPKADAVLSGPDEPSGGEHGSVA
jgi:ribosome-associated protein